MSTEEFSTREKREKAIDILNNPPQPFDEISPIFVAGFKKGLDFVNAVYEQYYSYPTIARKLVDMYQNQIEGNLK